MTEKKVKQRVNVERLKERIGKYALVVAVSQRARELKERRGRMTETNTAGLINNAMVEIAEARVKILADKD
ncbi:MAG: DNA-directed RNA polymerase subunit omega [bacterium]|jgi:DNA-directed RNA polymerase subunit K/omega